MIPGKRWEQEDVGSCQWAGISAFDKQLAFGYAFPMLRGLSTICIVFLWSVASIPAAEPRSNPITTGTLLEEMADLERLARLPEPAYRTVQFASYDRRSTSSEAPAWFSNADGFGREPIPNFQKVLREPRDGQPGLYLVAEVKGPGAIVRGWSAGMGGTLRVYLDPAPEGANPGDGATIWNGSAYDFLARRSSHFLKQAGIELDARDAFSQQDADYFPIPFQRGLKVTYEGKLDDFTFIMCRCGCIRKGRQCGPSIPRRTLRNSSPNCARRRTDCASPESFPQRRRQGRGCCGHRH